jgi:hypothetical protein
MVEHIVLFKIKESAGDDVRAELKRRLLALSNDIPGIIHATFGANFTSRGKGYTHGFVVRFTNQDSLANYQKHPLHVAVVEGLVRPNCDDVLALDYEI